MHNGNFVGYLSKKELYLDSHHALSDPYINKNLNQ